MAVAVLLAWISAYTQPELWPLMFLWPCLALAALAFDGLTLARVGRVHADVRVPPLLYLGESEQLFISLSARGACNVTGVLDVEGPLQPIETLEVWLQQDRVRGAAGADCALPLLARSRGDAKVARLWLRNRTQLGFAARTHRSDLDAKILISPNIRSVTRQAIAFMARDALPGMKTQLQRGEGTEFEAMREYALGMDTRHIDWKASARHRKLLCREFEAERNHQIILGLDTGAMMAETLSGQPKLDHAIVALLLLSYVSLKAGDKVGFAAFDSRSRAFIPPRGGMQTQGEIVRACSQVTYGSEETNFTLALADLRGRLSRRSLIVIATDFVDTITTEIMLANIEILARRHLVLFVSPSHRELEKEFMTPPSDSMDLARSVVAQNLMRERRRVFAKLARLGVLIVDSPAERLGGELINKYLTVKTREMI